jgi:putative Mn2+ efflux pump MntP
VKIYGVDKMTKKLSFTQRVNSNFTQMENVFIAITFGFIPKILSYLLGLFAFYEIYFKNYLLAVVSFLGFVILFVFHLYIVSITLNKCEGADVRLHNSFIGYYEYKDEIKRMKIEKRNNRKIKKNNLNYISEG